ncbi:MAG TPA: hypothetical protein PKH97_12450, partial [Tetrasphaera sp.]|uniref:hypothetical protein n=1 Tax=Nostocoides sp. TaxID=1917966 RepID=UPI002C675825
IVQRQDRFYVVAYDGLDPLTGKERRRWHPAGRDRHEAVRHPGHRPFARGPRHARHCRHFGRAGAS